MFNEKMSIVTILVLLSLSLESWAGKQRIYFEDITREAGITFEHERAVFGKQFTNIMPWLTAGGSAVAVGDFNNDGLDDLYFTTSKVGKRNHLYKNLGNLRFEEVGLSMGIGEVNTNKKQGTSSFALWLDYDNDGWQDLFLLRFGLTSIYKNVNGTKFREVTKKTGLLTRTNALSAMAFDYDNDGDLDIYIGGYFPEKNMHDPSKDSRILFDSWETARNAGRNYLYNNQGNGTFVDVTEYAGVHDAGWAMAVGHSDINNDGWQDIYIANDFGKDIVFKNLRNGKFKNISDTAIGIDTKKGMNTEFGDYNNDGLVDIYVTNMTEPYLHECNMLWMNNGNETFTDVSQESGSCDTDWGWGAKFVDINNDGLMDIYAANGFISEGKEDYMDILLDFIFREDIDLTDAQQWPNMQGYSMAGYENNYMLLQTPKGFIDISKESNTNTIRDSRGVAISDLDNDGLVDIIVSNVAAAPIIYKNKSTHTGNWVKIKLISNDKSVNRSAIGAKITAVTANGKHYREVMSASGFEAQSTLVQHIGLGAADRIERLEIKWTNGDRDEYKGLAVNQNYVYKLTIDE